MDELEIVLTFRNGESKTGDFGLDYSHWEAVAKTKHGNADYDAVGDTPLDAVMSLAKILYEASF